MYTATIAKLTNVHPNTVRLYETWGYISPVPRQPNGYRVYAPIHLKQMQIARLVFKQEFIQNNLRKFATKIVKYSGQEKFEQALFAAKQYVTFLQGELTFTVQAIETAQIILQEPPNCSECYTHKEVASKLQLSEETIRNWERNALFEVKRTTQNRRVYTQIDFQKLLIIRTLRSAHFSITSIRQLFDNLQATEHKKDIHSLLSIPRFQQDFYHVTDELEKNLKLAISHVNQTIAILVTLK
ncbi:MAG: MerR family transcriptional regulator [Kurthia sp.]|nr:MerR family transcriptional regulator [Candidatus Kurthia equi]